MKIYLDNCCFNRPFDLPSDIQVKLETDAKIYIQQLVEERKVDLAWSFILDYENYKNPHNDRKTFTNRFKPMANLMVRPEPEILKKTADFSKFNIKVKDCLHISCAIWANCDYFITTDYLLLKKRGLIKDIQVINPLEFIPIYKEVKS